MTNQERRQQALRESTVQKAVIFGLVVLGFVCPSPDAIAATVKPVVEQNIVVHKPTLELANPFKLGLPRYVAKKMAQFRTYRSMLANDDMSRLEDSVVRDLERKLESTRSYTLSVLPLYDLTEDASMYLAVAMAEDPAQSEIGHAGTFSLIRGLLNRPMSATNKSFVIQLRRYVANQVVRDQLATAAVR